MLFFHHFFTARKVENTFHLICLSIMHLLKILKREFVSDDTVTGSERQPSLPSPLLSSPLFCCCYLLQLEVLRPPQRLSGQTGSCLHSSSLGWRGTSGVGHGDATRKHSERERERGGKESKRERQCMRTSRAILSTVPGGSPCAVSEKQSFSSSLLEEQVKRGVG